jgi:hypothetical protein
MRQSTTLAIAAFAAGIAFNASAAEKSSDPCSLITWQDIQSFGAVKDTPMSDAGWHQEQTPKELPDSQLFTNMCAVVTKSPAGRSSITLSFDSFKGKATEQQIADWLKSTTRPADEEEAKPTVVTLGDTTCENGQYSLPTSQADDSVADVAEHYIACDKLVGANHVSLNIHVPEGDKAKLFSPEQAKALLDKAVSRMKANSFSIPDSKTAATGSKT